MDTKEAQDPLTVLPQEVALLILSKFTPEERVRVGLVSRQWHSLAMDKVR